VISPGGKVVKTDTLRVSSAPETVAGIGTPEYMAPEQWESTHEVDEGADIFAFGVCLYEMLCGRRPYEIAAGPRQEAPDPANLRGDDTFPSRLSLLLMRCVDWDRERRPEGATEIRKELCEIYDHIFGAPSPWAELPTIPLEADGWNNRGGELP
jgi:serine/threonine-protein kinase